MKREQLERFIVDAADGVLNEKEIQKLEAALEDHPDLYEDYKAMAKLPALDHLYTVESVDKHQKPIEKILAGIENQRTPDASFEEVTIRWFRKYALAAALAIFAITSLFSMFQPLDESETESETTTIEEFFYPVEESTADTYVLYLDELTVTDDDE